jgi:hypothetical protein
MLVVITYAQPTHRAPGAGPGGQIILHCGKLVDTKNKIVLETMSVIIEGNKITNVKKGYVIPGPSDKMCININNLCYNM